MAHPKYIEGAAKVASEGEHDERKIALAAVSAYGMEAIKATFLLNGGAIIALLAMLGGLYGKEGLLVSGATKSLTKSLVPAFQFFIGGVCGAAVTAGLGYLNWSMVAEQRFQPGHWSDWLADGTWHIAPKWQGIFIETTRLLAIVLFFGSLFSFSRGAWIASRAFLKVSL